MGSILQPKSHFGFRIIACKRVLKIYQVGSEPHGEYFHTQNPILDADIWGAIFLGVTFFGNAAIILAGFGNVKILLCLKYGEINIIYAFSTLFCMLTPAPPQNPRPKQRIIKQFTLAADLVGILRGMGGGRGVSIKNRVKMRILYLFPHV